jgi:hypothetical protein
LLEVNFQIEILYSTIALIQPNEDLNDWTDTHYKQGFSWRPTSVSFGTLDDSSKCEVTVKIADTFKDNDKAIRTIIVPFIIDNEGIEVVSILDSQPLDLPQGKYEVDFNAIPKSEGLLDTYEFIFIKCENPSARVLKADEQLSPPESLLMEAFPAI